MNHSFYTVFKVLLLLALCIAAAFALVFRYYFTFILMALAITALTTLLCLDHRKIIRRMEQIISRIRHGDLQAHFINDAKGVEGALNRAMNEALCNFRKRYREVIVSEAETEAWQKLIRVLAHEMMNSLTPIISLSETVIERVSNGVTGEKEYSMMLEAMGSIHRRSKGVVDFVENYRKLARIPDPVVQRFKVSALFDEVEKFLSNANVHFAIQPPHLYLNADFSQMEQVLINLIKNALESGGNQKQVEVEVKAFWEGENTAIQITDHGVGMEPLVLEKIFVPFYTTKQGGSGIGLSLSRQMVVRHKGVITVDSKVGKGTTFTIYIPEKEYDTNNR